MIELQYDTPVEVTKDQLREMMRLFHGTIVGREDDNGKCYIKLWMMSSKNRVEQYLNNYGNK